MPIAVSRCLQQFRSGKLSNSMFRTPPMKILHPKVVNRRTGLPLLYRTPIMPAGWLATSRQAPLARLSESLIRPLIRFRTRASQQAHRAIAVERAAKEGNEPCHCAGQAQTAEGCNHFAQCAPRHHPPPCLPSSETSGRRMLREYKESRGTCQPA
jgi:hypothetical protein